MVFSTLFVTPAEVHRALSDSPQNGRIVPVAVGKISALESFQSRHVPGSIYLDIDLLRDTTSTYPMMLPTHSQFADLMTKLGIRPDDNLLFYDSFDNGIYFSPRAAWTCRYLGHNKAHVLDNFRRYVQQEYPISTGELLSQLASSSTTTTSSVYEFDSSGHPSSSSTDRKLVTFEELQSLITDKSQTGKFQIVDARPADVFHGSKDAASGLILSGGHMPSAINVPLASILDTDKALMSPAELKARFSEAGVKEHLLTVLTCNSGVTAAVLDLAMHTSGLQLDTRLYDGSWSEWSKRVEGDGLIVTD